MPGPRGGRARSRTAAKPRRLRARAVHLPGARRWAAAGRTGPVAPPGHGTGGRAGRWAADEVCLLCPRQNGQTLVLLGLVLVILVVLLFLRTLSATFVAGVTLPCPLV